MFKKTVITVSSVLVLAACSSVPSEKSQGEFVTGDTLSESPKKLTSDPQVRRTARDGKSEGRTGVKGLDVSGDQTEMAGASEEVLNIRKDLIRSAGDRVHFGFDTAALTEKAQENLRGIAEFVKSNIHRIDGLTIEGHADERGTREYNLALGERRAVSAKRYLVGLGVDADMMSTISYGKERPVDPRHNERAWQRNRRAVVVLD